MSSDNARDLVVATLAAGIIQARKAVTVQDVQRAWLDARMIAFPRAAGDPAFKEWQVANGLTPTTPEEDEARAKARTEGMAKLADSARGPTGWMGR